jgi:glycosyltransferase involved in cell wall biosynthesis
MLAIIIPYYKLTYFEATLASLATQTDKQFKVYIGDDASQESPADLLAKYQGKVDFYYHRFDKNLGGTSLTQQWERCVALSGDEEWLMILGDDDLLDENVVEAFYINLKEIKKEGINVVRYATQVIDGNGIAISGVYTNPKFEKATDFYYRRYLGLVRSSLSEHIFSKTSYSRHKFKNYPIAWYSDDYAWIDFAENKPIFAINVALVIIRVSAESLSGRVDNNCLKIKAKSLFLRDIVYEKLMLFSKKQRLKLLMLFEIDLKKRKILGLSEWFVLLKLYLSNFELWSFLKFIRRFLVSRIQY